MIKTEPDMDTSPPYSLSITKSPPCSLPGAKTTAYTYQAFFASDGRAKKVPGKLYVQLKSLVVLPLFSQIYIKVNKSPTID